MAEFLPFLDLDVAERQSTTPLAECFAHQGYNAHTPIVQNGIREKFDGLRRREE